MSTSAELWVPGKDLAEEYPTPSIEELSDLWAAYTHDPNARPVEGVYGAFTEPKTPIKAVASIDVCEVLRDSAGSIDLASGREVTRRSNYAAGLWFEEDIEQYGSDYQQNFYTNILRVLMTHGHVPPVEDIDKIAHVTSDWRERGIYTVANTATLAGCETGTIHHTLGRYMLGRFDAIIFPRYFEGAGTVTKPVALEALGKNLDIDLHETPIVHIDDAIKHVKAFDDSRQIFGKLDLIVPRHADNGGEYPHCETETPLDAFLLADSLFERRGI